MTLSFIFPCLPFSLKHQQKADKLGELFDRWSLINLQLQYSATAILPYLTTNIHNTRNGFHLLYDMKILACTYSKYGILFTYGGWQWEL